jgi:hypothetical protein
MWILIFSSRICILKLDPSPMLIEIGSFFGLAHVISNGNMLHAYYLYITFLN